MLKLSRDENGNKTVTFSPGKGERGFSVQTLGNMPITHRMTAVDFNPFVAQNELTRYIKVYGTKRQQEILGV